MRPMFRFDVYTERHEGLKYEGSTTAVSEARRQAALSRNKGEQE